MWRFIDLDEDFYIMDPLKVIRSKEEKKQLLGFTLTRNCNSIEILSKKGSLYAKWMKLLSKLCIMNNYVEKYRTLTILGSGGYGKVSLSLLKVEYI